jgi:hypothetical protein
MADATPWAIKAVPRVGKPIALRWRLWCRDVEDVQRPQETCAQLKGEMPRVGSVVKSGPSATLRRLPPPHAQASSRAKFNSSKQCPKDVPRRALGFQAVDPPADHHQIAKNGAVCSRDLSSPTLSLDTCPNSRSGVIRAVKLFLSRLFCSADLLFSNIYVSG